MPLYQNSDTHFKGCMPAYKVLPGYVVNPVPNKIISKHFESSKVLSLSANLQIVLDEFLFDAIIHRLLRQWLEAEPSSFGTYYPRGIFQHCHKIGEGIYGEVFMYKNVNGPTVLKIIPIEGNQIVNGEHQKKFGEMLSEAIIATQLSNLRYNEVNCTDAFAEVQNIYYCCGKYPEELLELWKLHEETRGSENDSPDIFTDEQQYIVYETCYGGYDLESFIFDSASQAMSMFTQVTCALAVAEEAHCFEHRDLHWGNILLSRVPSNEEIIFVIDGKQIKVKSCGIKVTIIDFTFSRISKEGLAICNDLGKDDDIFNSTGDYQFEIYRLMQKKNGNEWQHFDPYSNVLWLSYILDKAITSLHYSDYNTKLHKKSMSKLKKLYLDILGYDSTREFVLYLIENNFFINNI